MTRWGRIKAAMASQSRRDNKGRHRRIVKQVAVEGGYVLTLECGHTVYQPIGQAEARQALARCPRCHDQHEYGDRGRGRK